jgi:hypothetical protein
MKKGERRDKEEKETGRRKKTEGERRVKGKGRRE